MNIKNVFLCAIINFQKWKVDVKIYTLFILIFVFSLWNFSGIYEYGRSVGEGVGPWIFPHIFTMPLTMPIYGCFAILLFSNAPFVDRYMPFVIARVGRGNWILGQLLYIFLASIVYTIIHYIITILSFFPYIDFTQDWGKVIRTLAVNPDSAYEKGIEMTVMMQNAIVMTFSAIDATLISLGLFFLVTLFIGIVIFSMNLIVGKMSGVITAGLLVFISYFSIYVGRLTIGYKVYYFSPLSWNSLQYIDWYSSGDAPSFQYAITFLVGVSLLLSILSIISFSRKDVNFAEGLE